MMVPDTTLRALTGYRLQRATGAATTGFKAAFADHGLRRTTFSCLSLIVDNPGLKQSQLGETLAIERPNLVNIVEDLVSQRLIRKEVSTADRRAYALFPTAEGLTRFDAAHRAVQAVDAEMTKGLSRDEIAALHTLLEKLERLAATPNAS